MRSVVASYMCFIVLNNRSVSLLFALRFLHGLGTKLIFGQIQKQESSEPGETLYQTHCVTHETTYFITQSIVAGKILSPKANIRESPLDSTALSLSFLPEGENRLNKYSFNDINSEVKTL